MFGGFHTSQVCWIGGPASRSCDCMAQNDWVHPPQLVGAANPKHWGSLRTWSWEISTPNHEPMISWHLKLVSLKPIPLTPKGILMKHPWKMLGRFLKQKSRNLSENPSVLSLSVVGNARISTWPSFWTPRVPAPRRGGGLELFGDVFLRSQKTKLT